MMYQILLTLFIISSSLLVLLIFIQKGKGSMGLGSIGGGTQMLFGGSGGQDIFQKMTWILGAIFMGGSLILSMLKSSGTTSTRYVGKNTAPITQSMPQK